MAAYSLSSMALRPQLFRLQVRSSASPRTNVLAFFMAESGLHLWRSDRNSMRAAADAGRIRGPIITDVPLDQIRRPLLRTRKNDPDKVKSLMESIAQIGLQEPIDVLEVDGIYYGFSGCHRYEAHLNLGLPTIRCKIRRGTKETLRHHLR